MKGYWKAVDDKIVFENTTKAVTNVRGYWRRNPKTGEKEFVHQYQRHYRQGRTPAPGMPAPVQGDEHAPLTVNFTAYRTPDQEGIAHTGEETYTELDKFVNKLDDNPNIKVLSFAPTLGAWDTGSEPSAVLKLFGNYDEIKRELSAAGKRWVQDAIVISRPNSQSDRKSFYFKIDAPIDKENRSIIKQILLKNGIGGWTWLRGKNGERFLNVMHFPEWGTEMSAQKAEKIKTALNKLHINTSWNAYGIDMDILAQPYTVS